MQDIFRLMKDPFSERKDLRWAQGTVSLAVTVSESYEAREPLPLWVPRDAVTEDYRHAVAWGLDNDVFTVS